MYISNIHTAIIEKYPLVKPFTETRYKSLRSSVIFLNLKEGSELTNRAVLPSKKMHYELKM
jgi:hypothetical protein